MSKVVVSRKPVAESTIERLRAYWQLSKPRVTLLVWITNLLGMLLAGGGPTALFVANLTGAWFVVAAANALNQVIEAQADRQMERTKHRPIPSGRLSANEATFVGVAWGIIGLSLLAVFVNAITALLGAVSIGLYVFGYTLLKPRSHLCTVIGAIPGAIPPLAGFTAVTGAIEAPGLLLFALQFFWQFPHFWAIAWLLREDYAKVAFKMLPYPGADGRATALCSLQYALPLLPLSLLASLQVTHSLVLASLVGAWTLWFLSYPFRFVKSQDELTARKLLKATIAYLPVLLIVMSLCR